MKKTIDRRLKTEGKWLKGGMCAAVFLIAYSLQPTAFCGTIAELHSQVEVSKPGTGSDPIILNYGETVDLALRFTDYSVPMCLTGATVVLHSRTNGMATNLSFQVTGSVGRVSSPSDATNGWVYARIDVDHALPAVELQNWTMEVSGSDGNLLRGQGMFRLRGTSAGSVAMAQSSLSFDPAGAAQGVSNALAAASSNLAALVWAEHRGRTNQTTHLSNWISRVSGLAAAATTPADVTNITAGLIAAIPPVTKVAMPGGWTWTETRSDGEYQITETISSSVYVSGTNGDGYNGPPPGTVWANPVSDGFGNRNWDNSGPWSLAEYPDEGTPGGVFWQVSWIAGGWTFNGMTANQLPVASGYTWDAGAGSLTIDYVPITNIVKLATMIMLVNAQANATDQWARAQLSSIPQNATPGGWTVPDSGTFGGRTNIVWSILALNGGFYIAYATNGVPL